MKIDPKSVFNTLNNQYVPHAKHLQSNFKDVFYMMDEQIQMFSFNKLKYFHTIQ